ncbi:uncharacterized protein LOC121237114 [Juglans microcarpa x Juglans regia]|uniref:uncharacterized protein LOC121237114 n=1 Tax=Juglans microcarpa x Juglans regia TaxID=2249226 RepID=UPI001B7F16C1|nr:uncharacterized protein LOC121237114 [Juglans microcarpa x Juglans regia]
MGACVSSQETETSKSRGKLEGKGRGQRQAQEQADWCNNKQQSKTTKVIHMNYGWLNEIKLPMQAKAVTSQNPNCFLCSSESLSIGKRPTQVPPEEEQQPGHIYFLMPLSHDCFEKEDQCFEFLLLTQGQDNFNSVQRY